MSPGRPDSATLERHLLALDDAVRRLRPHASVGVADLVSDGDLRWSLERGLQLCAQNAIDIATHIAASHGIDASDYVSAIEALGDLGVLPREFAASFREVAGFRNVLVHGYLDVDPEVLRRVLATRLDDFSAFAEHVRRQL